MNEAILLISFFLSFHGSVFASDRIYYVTPVDEGGTCDVGGDVLEPCLPLTNYTSDMLTSNVSYHANITMLFLPGEHNVTNQCNLSLYDIDTFMMSPYYNERGNAAVNILCADNGEVNMYFSSLRVLKIHSLWFLSCAKTDSILTLWGSSPDYFELINCSFHDNVQRIVFYLHTECKWKEWTTKKAVIITASNFIHNGGFLRPDLIKLTKDKINHGQFVEINFSVSDCIFERNTVDNILHFDGAENLEMSNCTFINNEVEETVVYVNDYTNLEVRNCLFENNFVRLLRTLIIKRCEKVELYNSTFLNNIGGAVKLELITSAFLRKTNFIRNRVLYTSGGGLFISQCENVTLSDMYFANNTAAQFGGAVYAEYSLISTVSNSGLFISQCENVTLSDMYFANNEAAQFGGAVYAEYSLISTVSSTIHIINNTAGSSGGGVALGEESNLELSHGSEIYFSNNSVTGKDGKGGAIFVYNDCSVRYSTCPIYVQSYSDYANNTGKYLHFNGNYAAEGPILYGCQLDTCSMLQGGNLSGNTILNLMTSGEPFDPSHALSSEAVELCFCKNNKPDCTTREKNISLFPGQTIVVPVVGINQLGGLTSSYIDVKIISGAIIAVYNILDKIPAECQDIHVEFNNIYYLTYFETEIINTIPCSENLKVYYVIKPCPPGFEPTDVKCICDNRLLELFEECYIDDLRGKLRTNGWFEYDQKFLKVMINKYFCPLNYCTKKKINVSFIESQCVNNRKGVLCGACADNYSIGLGSWRCLQCTHSQYNFIWLVPLIATAGVVLVVFLLLLKLTVSSGTMNGLVFYANVISASGLINLTDCSINPMLSIFVSWVNLDFGIEICFYSGMDAYQKSWLQFAFPLYIWFLVGIIIIVCHYSSRAMKLMGKRCIDILATLFLLSYAKLLKTVITAFSSVNIMIAKADDVSDPLVPHKVWTYDGNVDYLTGKHLPLFVVILFFLILLFLPYTLLLTFGQCLRSLPRKRGLRWVRSTAFISIMDAYHAPYNRRHRYWTGLTLLTRGVLFIVFAANTNNILTTNMFTTAIITSLLLVIRLLVTNTTYKNYFIDKLDLSFLLNLEFLVIIFLYLESVGADEEAYCKVITASIVLSFNTFIGIVIYHFYLQVKDRRFFKEVIKKYKYHPSPVVVEIPSDSSHTTTSFIQLREDLLDSTKLAN